MSRTGVMLIGWICLAACLPSTASEPSGDCSKWAVHGIRAGADSATATALLESATSRWRKMDGDDAPPRSVYRLGYKDAPEGARESLLLAMDLDGQRITAATWIIEKPVRGLLPWAEEIKGLWGEPTLDRYVLGTGNLFTEASIWTDPACDVRAVLLAERARTGAGFRFMRLTIRVELAGDPTGNLDMLLLKVRNLEN